MAAVVQIDRLGVTSCSVSSLCVCPCRPYSKALTFPNRTFKLTLAPLNRPRGAAARLGVRSSKISNSRRLFVTAVAREEEADPANIQLSKTMAFSCSNFFHLPTPTSAASRSPYPIVSLIRPSIFQPLGIRADGGISLVNEIPPNAVRRSCDPQWTGGFSLGVDLGLARTGLALSKGYSLRPLTVLNLRGQKLDLKLIEIAEKEEADEFIIGLPRSFDGKETPQSNKVRAIAGRFAVQAADRGWRVYLQDEHGTSTEAVERMINLGVRKSAQQGSIDAYAAMMILERYYSVSGKDVELVLPKRLELQEKLRKGPPEDNDYL